MSNAVSIMEFCNAKADRNAASAETYKNRLKSFESFVRATYKKDTDALISELKAGQLGVSVYDLLSGYMRYEREIKKQQPATLKAKVLTAKKFLVYHDVDISDNKFRERVSLPRVILEDKEPMDIQTVRLIINSCKDLKLRTYIMLLAATGLRAVEALSIRHKDIDFQSNPARITIRGEHTKTGRTRYVFLTKELKTQLQYYINFKHRRRDISIKDGDRYRRRRFQPEVRPTDLLFSVYHENKTSSQNPKNLYPNIALEYEKLLDSIGLGEREDNTVRRKITLHSFRRFVKTTIANLGYEQFSEWVLGHNNSTYWRVSDEEKAKLFQKNIESYLTFVDMAMLEARGTNIEAKLEEKDAMIKQLQQQMKSLLQNQEQVFRQLYEQELIKERN